MERAEKSCISTSQTEEEVETATSRTTNLTPIQNFFANCNVLVTGATGFLGILLLEKLLVSCRDISKIFLLVRSKKGKDPNTRLDELFQDVVFSRLRAQYPNFREKIVLVEGDCELPQLGLGSQDREMLSQEVHIVFHAAATVRFDEALKKASFINVRALKDILTLARRMHNLKSFMHVSTAYSNCIHDFIKEEIYPAAMDYVKLLHVTEALPDDVINKITPKLVGRYPNTYAYTKQIGEAVLKEEGKGLPIGINRPSIVISTYQEPLKGWINNFYGPTGVIAGGGVGLIRTVDVDLNCKSNLVPADMVINSIIATAWDVAENFKENIGRVDKIPVYNFVTTRDQSITWGYYTETCRTIGRTCPPLKTLWYMFSVHCSNHLGQVVLQFLLHTLPAYVVDGVRVCQGKRPMLSKVYKKINKLFTVIRYFANREWEIQSDKIPQVIKKMSEEDREIFPFDLGDMDWSSFLEYHVRGVRVYMIKDPFTTLPQALKRQRKWVHLCINLIVQLALGVPLEMTHKWWRVLVIYISPASWRDLSQTPSPIPNPDWLGQIAHIACAIMNWSEMMFPAFQMLVYVAIVACDLGTSIYNRYFLNLKTSVGTFAHVGGALAGLLVGIYILRNLQVRRTEKYIWWAAVVIYIVLMGAAIIINIAWPGYFATKY